MSADRSSAARRRDGGGRGRLRELLIPRSEHLSSTWDAPPAHYTAIEDAAALPERIDPRGDEAWLVPNWTLCEALVSRGAPSARIAVAHAGQQEAWIDALTTAGAADPILPPQPHDFGVRMLVVLPTYNEAENIRDMTTAIRRYLRSDVLVVDDNSPDGTGKLADELAAQDSGIHVLHRSEKKGLGPAYVAGFYWALDRDYDRVFEMDCDFSHAPWDLPRLAAASEDAELVIGSRYVRGGTTVGWSFGRRLLSRGANLYTKLWLGFGVKDYTAGFRCYHAELLRKLPLDALAASGYSFQIELAHRTRKAGGRIRELPISFVDRKVGKSKMDRAIALEALRVVPSLRFKR